MTDLKTENARLREALSEIKNIGNCSLLSHVSQTKKIIDKALSQTPIEADTSKPIAITYTNYRGKTSTRNITPIKIWHGATEWHPKEQWILTAYDHDKKAERGFALADIGAKPTPPVDRDKLLYLSENAVWHKSREISGFKGREPYLIDELMPAIVDAILPMLGGGQWWEDEGACFAIYQAIARARKIQPSVDSIKRAGHLEAMMELAILEYLPKPPEGFSLPIPPAEGKKAMSYVEKVRDLTNYQMDLAIVQSHLEAARLAIVGIYLRNPCTHEIPAFDGLSEQFEKWSKETRKAQILASNKMFQLKDQPND